MSTGNPGYYAHFPLLLISGLDLGDLIHIRVQCLGIYIPGEDQAYLGLPGLTDQITQLFLRDHSLIQDSQDLIQDQNITFARNQDLFRKIDSVADADPCLFLFFL